MRGKGASLGTYHAKRDLRKSGEPDADSARVPGPLRFVIQRHDATRLHFDLRLEMDGVFKSWAVPKGIPMEPGKRVLAIEVEDHPLSYGSFEGVIPPGNYGAGTVEIWDKGAYLSEGGAPAEALRLGKIHFALSGKRCQGEWTLVRMNSAPSNKTEWLLMKNRPAETRAAASDRVKPVKARKSHRSSRGLPAALPDFVEPMKALGTKRVPAGNWLLEVKFDGYRALAGVGGEAAKLWSRNHNDIGSQFPSVVAALRKLPCKSALLDGEVVALDAQGRPRFQLLQRRYLKGSDAPIRYYIFDLLELDHRRLGDRPIEERKKILDALLKGIPDPLCVSTVFKESAARLLEAVKRRGLEGIVAKAAGSPYEPGLRTGAWLKCRVSRDQEFVIGGYTEPGGTRSHFGAILVGYREGESLRYAGKVGTGFDEATLRDLHRRFEAIRSKKCPFSKASPGRGRPHEGEGWPTRGVTWLKPRLVAQIRFGEWTQDGLLRHPVYLGLRTDKAAAGVVREVTAEAAA